VTFAPAAHSCKSGRADSADWAVARQQGLPPETSKPAMECFAGHANPADKKRAWNRPFTRPQPRGEQNSTAHAPYGAGSSAASVQEPFGSEWLFRVKQCLTLSRQFKFSNAIILPHQHFRANTGLPTRPSALGEWQVASETRICCPRRDLAVEFEVAARASAARILVNWVSFHLTFTTSVLYFR
jgi:hypothetical protein